MPREEQALLLLVQHLQFIVLPHKQNIDNSIHDNIAWQLVACFMLQKSQTCAVDSHHTQQWNGCLGIPYWSVDINYTEAKKRSLMDDDNAVPTAVFSGH